MLRAMGQVMSFVIWFVPALLWQAGSHLIQKLSTQRRRHRASFQAARLQRLAQPKARTGAAPRFLAPNSQQTLAPAPSSKTWQQSVCAPIIENPQNIRKNR